MLIICVRSDFRLKYILSYLVGLASGIVVIVVHTGCYCPVLGQYQLWRRKKLWCNLKGYTSHYAHWNTHRLTWAIRPSSVVCMSHITRPLSTILDNILLVLLRSSRLKRSFVDICDVMLFGLLSLSGRIPCGRPKTFKVVFSFQLQGKPQCHSLYMHGT